MHFSPEGPGSIPGLVFILVEVSPGFSLNCKTNVRKSGPHSSSGIIWPSYIIRIIFIRLWTATVSDLTCSTWPSLNNNRKPSHCRIVVLLKIRVRKLQLSLLLKITYVLSYTCLTSVIFIWNFTRGVFSSPSSVSSNFSSVRTCRLSCFLQSFTWAARQVN